MVKQGEIGENFYVIEQVVIVTTIVIVMITIFVVFMTTIMVVVMTTVLFIVMITVSPSPTYVTNADHDPSSQGQATIQVGEPSGKQVVNIAVGEGGSFGELALIYGEFGIMVNWSW